MVIHWIPSSRAPLTASSSASSPAAWPSVRGRPRARPAAVAVHDAGHVDGHPRPVEFGRDAVGSAAQVGSRRGHMRS